jgi:hypothetical protein
MAKEKRLLSRRDFLVAGGAVIAAGALSACTPKTETVTNTVTNTVTKSTPVGQEKIQVLQPLGTPAAITKTPMAARPSTLDGGTVYVVDIMYPYSQNFVMALRDVLAEKYPKTTWVYREKIGSYATNDPDLWAEISGRAVGAVFAIGH